jgi:hypothetical protein
MSKVQPSIICYYQPAIEGMLIPATEVFIDTDGNRATAEYHTRTTGFIDLNQTIKVGDIELKNRFPNMQLGSLAGAKNISTEEYSSYVDHTKLRTIGKWPNEVRELPVTNFPTSF